MRYSYIDSKKGEQVPGPLTRHVSAVLDIKGFSDSSLGKVSISDRTAIPI